jgi:adenylate cyclase
MEGAENISSPARELAAIMFSDIAGYTAIMGRDEQAAMRALDAHRGTLRTLLPKFNGTLIGEIGDGTLSSFHSAIDAVNCAREVQARVEDNPELRLRIGIHLGDVVFTNNTVIGDGVNVASRIHALAPPGGICISEHVYDEIRNKPGMRAKDLGKQRLKNVSRPIRVYALQAVGLDLPTGSKLGKRVAMGAIVSGLIVAIVMAYVYRAQILAALPRGGPAVAGGKVTLAVLPFANLSANKDDEYFSDGMTDEIRGDLSKIEGLQVIARTSSFAFKGQNEDVKKIGRLLNVRNVLEGSVRKSADRVRIEVELIDATNGFTVWSDRYNEKMADVFQIQSEVAESLTQNLRVKLLPSVRDRINRRPTQNLEAYDLYLQGQYYLSRYSEDGWNRAVEAFNRAIEKDPKFALAYVGLANAYGGASDFTMSPRDAVPKARAALERALALDDSLGEAHGVLAYIVLYGYDWNWVGAEREFKRALELDPSNAPVHTQYGDFLDRMGRFDEALEQEQRAQELDPLSVWTVLEIGWVYRDSRNYQRALDYFRQAIDRAPDLGFAYMSNGVTHESQGDVAAALRDFEKAAALEHTPVFYGWLGTAYAQTGRRSDALKILADMKAQSANRYVDPMAFVGVCWALGDNDRAFQWMDKAYDERSFFLVNLKLPMFDALRSDPRFQAIYKKVGLPP